MEDQMSLKGREQACIVHLKLLQTIATNLKVLQTIATKALGTPHVYVEALDPDGNKVVEKVESEVSPLENQKYNPYNPHNKHLPPIHCTPHALRIASIALHIVGGVHCCKTSDPRGVSLAWHPCQVHLMPLTFPSSAMKL